MKVGLILAVIIYEIAVVAIVSIVLKAVEKKKAHTAAVSGDDKDFLLAGRNMGVITLAPTIALTVLGSAHITGVFENAMEALEQLSVSYADVIITDIKMPEINGLDLINRIREKDENTKIIILSGYSDFSFAQRAIELGVTRYLTKPTNARELIGILEEIEKNIQKPRSEEKQEMKVTNLFVQKAMDYISMNYSQKLTLTKISEQLCITPNYLSELFKKHTGQNVSEYIIDYRLEKACQFLKNPQLRIGEVSEKVGINDVRYFSSMFKKKYNLTPTEYRNKQ